MSQSTKIYLYHQRHMVVLLDTSSGCYHTRRYSMPYARNLKAHKGTDNRILIEFVNQDQKPTPLDGIEFMFRIISGDGNTLLLEKKLEIVNKGRGQARVILTEQELDVIQTGTAKYSIERHYFVYPSLPIEPVLPDPTDPPVVIQPIWPPECLINGPNGPQDPVNPEEFEQVDYEPAYVDDNGGGRGNIDILDSIMPAFVSSSSMTLPDVDHDEEYASSIINTDQTSFHTFQINLSNFVGSITFEGATNTDNQWYNIEPELLINDGNIMYANIKGYHPFMRLYIRDNTSGIIDNITFR